MVTSKNSKFNQLCSVKRSVKLKHKSRNVSVTKRKESSERNLEAEVDDLKLKVNEMMRTLGDTSKCLSPKRDLEVEIDELKLMVNDIMRMLKQNLKLKEPMENVDSPTQNMTSAMEIPVNTEVPPQLLPSNAGLACQARFSPIPLFVQKTSKEVGISALPNLSKILPNYRTPSHPSHSNPLNFVPPPPPHRPTTPNSTSFNQIYPVNPYTNLASRPLIRPDCQNERDKNAPFPNIPMTKLELFKQLVDARVLTPRHIRPQQPPFPHWYNPNLRCEFHWGTVGHSIETCPAFKEVVIYLMREGKIIIDGRHKRVIVSTNSVPNQA